MHANVVYEMIQRNEKSGFLVLLMLLRIMPVRIWENSMNRNTCFHSCAMVFVLFFGGCGGSTDAPPTANVSLTLTVGGTPVPAKTTVKVSPTGKGQPVVFETNAEGVASGQAVVGEATVSVVAVGTPEGSHGSLKASGIDPKFGNESSPLKLTVKADGTTKESFELGTAIKK